MFNFIDIYIVIPVSGCVVKGPSALLYPGSMMLLRRSWVRTLEHNQGISSLYLSENNISFNQFHYLGPVKYEHKYV